MRVKDMTAGERLASCATVVLLSEHHGAHLEKPSLRGVAAALQVAYAARAAVLARLVPVGHLVQPATLAARRAHALQVGPAHDLGLRARRVGHYPAVAVLLGALDRRVDLLDAHQSSPR